MSGARILVILFVISAFLISGCCISPPQQSEVGETGTPGGGTPSGGTGTGGGTSPGTETGGGAATGGATGGETNDLVGKSYEQLLGLGVPMQCDITTSYQGKSTTVRSYMKGQAEVRSETSTTEPGSTCKKFIFIGKGDKFYMGCADGAIFPDTGDASNPFAGCEWLEMTVNKSTSGGTQTYAVPDYSDVPPAQINCQPWLYDSSKFVISGKTCNLDEIMKSLQSGGYPSGYE